jgi:hypothetical protein
MTAPLIVPFDNNPVARYTKTSSYTIPSGHYAKVTPITPYLIIDGVQQYHSFGMTASKSGSGTATQIASCFGTVYITASGNISFTTGSFSYGVADGNGGASVSVASRTSSGTMTSNSITASQIYVSATSAGGGGDNITISATVYCGFLTDFWVKSGTVLDGGKYKVEEYIELT